MDTKSKARIHSESHYSFSLKKKIVVRKTIPLKIHFKLGLVRFFNDCCRKD